MVLKRWFAIAVLVCTAGILAGCSSAPSGPEIGSPAFYWEAARSTWVTGDYSKTLDNLDQVLATDNPYTARALPWFLVAASGVAAGNMELADACSTGARVNKSNPIAFRRQASEVRTAASKLTLRFAETVGKISKLNGDIVSLAFPYPKGSAAPVPQMAKLGSGIELTPQDIDAAQKHAIERGVLLAACRAAGAPNDTAKAEEVFKSPTPQTARPAFLLAMAGTLYDESQLYATDKLDDPEKLSIFCQRAQEILTGLPESKESKDLGAKIATALKKKKKT